jgi:hypothetical protein
MNFSWREFVKANGIHYVSSGPSTAKGNIYVHCPFCGNADRSTHMGLSLNVRLPFFACWKDSTHRGRYPPRLIAALLGCSYADAVAMVDAEDSSAIDDYEAAVSRTLAPAVVRPSDVHELQMPKTFRVLDHSTGERFVRYLERRGFTMVERFASYYGLRYCPVGAFAQRIILPVFHEHQLVTWTGRDITGMARLRYETLSTKPEVAQRQGSTPALLAVGETVFNYDRAAEGGRTLVICEGPFDALKIDWFCEDVDVAVAVFGMPKNRQQGILVRLAQGFERVRVLLDGAATSKAWRLCWEELEAVLGNTVARLSLPEGVKDPGALRGDQVVEILS